MKKRFGSVLTLVAVAGMLAGAPLAAAAADDATIVGQIVSVDGKYHVTMRDSKGALIHVLLHQGTVILPTGIPLAKGMVGTVFGARQNDTLDANEIRTPYQWHGYPAFGYPVPNPDVQRRIDTSHTEVIDRSNGTSISDQNSLPSLEQRQQSGVPAPGKP